MSKTEKVIQLRGGAGADHEAARLADDFITIEELARRLNCSPKTIRNKMSGKRRIFYKGVHYSEAPGLPVMFRWSAVLSLYTWAADSAPTNRDGSEREATEEAVVKIPMVGGYEME